MTLATSKDESVYEAVTGFLTKKFKIQLGENFNEHTDLFQEGLIDSFGFVELVGFLEKTFYIHFEDAELTTNSLNTVDNIVTTVKRKTVS
jgi:acyl carrier protein